MADELPKFEQLPDCCMCNGAAMELVRHDPQVSFMPALKTYRCPECGHVVTTEVDEPGGSKAAY